MSAARENKRQINARVACYRLRIGRSKLHRYGVFALEDIPRDRRVIEYTGKRLRIEQAVKISPPNDIYIARISGSLLVDGRRGGSGAEFMNHSCQPNLKQRRVRGHLLFFSRRKIRAGEELTWNYHYRVKLRRIPCHCDVRGCRGTLRLIVS
ncbi:MAG: SET domain-containing protein-lysine N-methyltransferase [Candidatus Acidiferrales bacterium]